MSQTPPPNDRSREDAAAEQAPEQLSFEQAVEQLEQLIEKIESGEVGLEQALKHYEQGTQLIQRCRSILDSAEKRVAELTADEQGRLQVEGEQGPQKRGDAPADEEQATDDETPGR